MSAHAENGARIVPAGRVEAVHYLGLATVTGWNGRQSIRAIACGRPVAHDPERYTDKPREVTCDECRMHPTFAAARRGGP